jgi:glycosyltransferase involved in cell wall biosynthesis
VTSIVIADSTNRYDGRSLASQPFAVSCYTNCDVPIEHDGVAWRPLDGPRPDRPDVHVAVQHPGLLSLAVAPRRRIIWMTWRPNNLRHYKQLWRMWLYRPRPIFMSEHQAGLYSRWLPPMQRREILPLGLPDEVRGRPPLLQPPAPHAIFASNPTRNLAWLIRIWSQSIAPRVPGAKLLVYGIRNYDWRYGSAWKENPGLATTFGGIGASVDFRPTATREELWSAMRASRVMLYGGHASEMFCLAVAEAQALGVPCVVRPVAVLPERLRNGETGFIRADDAGFAEAAVRLLTDDRLWRRQHEAALRLQQGWSWDQRAAEFERAVLS